MKQILMMFAISALFEFFAQAQKPEDLFRRNTAAAMAAAAQQSLPPQGLSSPADCAPGADRIGFSVWGEGVRLACRDANGKVRQEQVAVLPQGSSVVGIARLAEGEYFFLEIRGALIRGRFEAGGAGVYYRWPVAPAVSLRLDGWNAATAYGFEGPVAYWHWDATLALQVARAPIDRVNCQFFVSHHRGDDFCLDLATEAIYRVPTRFFREKEPWNPELFFQAPRLTRFVIDGDQLWALAAPEFKYPEPVCGPQGMCGTPAGPVFVRPGKLMRIKLDPRGDSAPETILSGVDVDFSTNTGLLARGGKVYLIANGPRGPKGEVDGKQILEFDEKTGKLTVFLSVREIGGDYPFLSALTFLN